MDERAPKRRMRSPPSANINTTPNKQQPGAADPTPSSKSPANVIARLSTPPSRQSTLDGDLLKGMGIGFPPEQDTDNSASAGGIPGHLIDPGMARDALGHMLGPVNPLTPAITVLEPEEEDVLKGIGRPDIPPVHIDEEDLQQPVNNMVGAGGHHPLISLSEDTLRPLDMASPSTPIRVQRWQHEVKVFAVENKDKRTEESDKAHGHGKRGEKKSYPCDQCGRVFASRSELRHHARRYEKRPYTCDECDRSFLYPKDLRRHKTTHSGTKQYKCRLCPKSFSRKDNLRRHISNEHGLSNVPLSPDLVAVDTTAGRRNREPSQESDRGYDNNQSQQPGFPSSHANVSDPALDHSQSQDIVGGAFPINERTNLGPADHEIAPELQSGVATPYDPRKGGGSNQPTIGDFTNIGNQDAEDLDDSFAENPGDMIGTNAATDYPFLMCPLRRWKPIVHRKCNGKFRDHAKVIHHLKQSHKIFFHATCIQKFATREELESHLAQECCCRSCRKTFPSREVKDRHIRDTHDSHRAHEPKAGHQELWAQVYEQACGDGVVHNPFWGEDWDGAEERARELYPVPYYLPVEGSVATERSGDIPGRNGRGRSAASVRTGEAGRQGLMSDREGQISAYPQLPGLGLDALADALKIDGENSRWQGSADESRRSHDALPALAAAAISSAPRHMQV